MEANNTMKTHRADAAGKRNIFVNKRQPGCTLRCFVVYCSGRFRRRYQRRGRDMNADRSRFRGLCSAAAVCLVLLLLAVHPLFPAAADEGTRLVALNAGKADCLLLLSGDQAFLIDTGLEQTWPLLKAMLEEYHVQSLDGVFLTHCHKDHYGSIMQLAASDIPVGRWYAPSIYHNLPDDMHPAQAAAGVRGESVEWLSAGDVIVLSNGASFTVLGPVTENRENENNNSLVMRFACQDGSILLCGDMKSEEEAALLSRGSFTQCDILKCGHHGDGKATGEELLNAVRPKHALICTSSAEEPDTPSWNTVRRLEKAGCRITVTQDAEDAVEMTLLDGDVAVRSVAFAALPERISGITMRADAENDLLFITSADGDATVQDAVLYSSEGTQLFSLGTITVPSSGLTVGSAKSTGDADLILPGKKRLFNTKKLDVAVLYDAWGRGIAWADNGLTD